MTYEQHSLFDVLTPPCGECPNLGDAINSDGTAYCHAQMTWRGTAERVHGCTHRGEAVPRFQPAGSRVEAIRDLLESPRHSISPKDRRWLKAELRAELKARAA